MTGFYVNDISGRTWLVSANLIGEITTTFLGTGHPVPPLVRLNNVPITTTTNSWLIGIETDGTVTAEVISYNALYPFFASLNETFGWSLEIDPTGTLLVFGGIPGGCPIGNPHIIYPSAASGLPQAISSPLCLLHPFTKVPFTSLKAIRHDNRSSSGVQEVIFERMDEFFEGKFKYLALGTDAISWKSFALVALTGVPFDYHPTGDPSVYTTYFLDDVDWKPAYRVPGFYEFDMRFYQRVDWP